MDSAKFNDFLPQLDQSFHSGSPVRNFWEGAGVLLVNFLIYIRDFLFKDKTALFISLSSFMIPLKQLYHWFVLQNLSFLKESACQGKHIGLCTFAQL